MQSKNNFVTNNTTTATTIFATEHNILNLFIWLPIFFIYFINLYVGVEGLTTTYSISIASLVIFL